MINLFHKKANKGYLLLCSMIVLQIFPVYCRAGGCEIVVQDISNGKEINKKVFGSNFLGYDPKTYENNCKRNIYSYSDFGSGLWDPIAKQNVQQATNIAREIGIYAARFPGGAGATRYNWKETIGSERKHFLFGIDEFLRTCELINTEPIFTIGCLQGTSQDAADLVEYCNGISKDINGKEESWVSIRIKNGRAKPYGVRYFEIGNELYLKGYEITPEDYAGMYSRYYKAMKAKDASIKLGAILERDSWNSEVVGLLKDKIDFGIIHIYPGWDIDVSKMNARDIFLASFSQCGNEDVRIKNVLSLFKRKIGRVVPLAITEYNGGFPYNDPIPYRHCLGTALLNAELLRIFMKPENNILMANHWNFCNEYWGMIANEFKGDYKDLYKPYYKRPNYYVFEMYHKHFGDMLLNASVQCDTYDVSYYNAFKTLVTKIKTGTLIKNNLAQGKWDIKELPGVTARERDGELSLDFQNPGQFNYYHCSKRALVEPNAYYKVSGYIKTENFVDDIGVCLEVQDARGWNVTHSAAATEKIKSAIDWQYVETVYQTLPDAQSVNVIARRIGEKGPLSGRVYFKDVRLEKFIPQIDSKIPYLSVNVSKSKDGKKVYLMVINKNMDNAITATISLQGFTPATEGLTWTLNGPAIDSTNEQNHDNVKVTPGRFKISSNPFAYAFPAHSLTAIEVDSAN